MGSKYRNSFFDEKRDWSKYKDAVLNYYLTPYLQKVKEIKNRGARKPICIVDMFAGRGQFKTGEAGSPLIIAGHLNQLAKQGYQVKLQCYETYEDHFDHLATVLKPFPFATALKKDCFGDMENVAKIASSHTTLLYIDPCDVNQLVLSKLRLVFDKVFQNQSIEALIVFMARAFLRQAAWARSVEMRIGDALNDPLVADADDDDKAMWLDALHDRHVITQHAQLQETRSLLNSIMGSNFWEALVDDKFVSWEEKILQLVEEYKKQLHNWFRCVEALPVRPDTSPLPKYWIAFTSRYEPAFDLFNRAACRMMRAREVNIRNQPGTLFVGIDTEPEAPPPQTVDRAVKQAAKPFSEVTWRELRWTTCGGRNVGVYTDSEVNQSIKRLIKSGWLSGTSGDKVEEKALLHPTQH
jgi:three-Cys-motif partner protein